LTQETTGLCPFLETCETHRDLKQTQTRLIKERRESLFETSSLEQVKIDTIMVSYKRKFVKLGRIEARCTSYYGWCLRFWQILRLENGDDMMGQYDNISVDQVTTG
jgi:hypothetical protein